MKSIRVVVKGKVQGVGFRAWLAERANESRLAGWVRNRRNGTVEAVLSGPGARVDSVVANLWEGPAFAQVDDLAIEDLDGPAPDGFSILPTV